MQPRYQLEMALLRWIHLRKLVPLTELLSGAGVASGPSTPVRPLVSPPASSRPMPANPEPPPEERPGATVPADKPRVTPGAGGAGKDAFLAEIRRAKSFFYNTVVAQAQSIDFGPDRVSFVFLPAHRTLREQVEQNRTWLESVAASIAGRPMPVRALQQEGAEVPPAGTRRGARSAPAPVDLKATAMSDTTAAMLTCFRRDRRREEV